MPNHGLRHATKNRSKFIDRFIYFVAIAYPAATLPQVFKIFIEKNAESIAISTWLLYVFFAGSWIVYGFYHKEKPIILSNILWISTYLAVIIGALLY